MPAFFHQLTVSPEVMTIGIPFLAVTTLALILAALDNMIRQWEGGGLLLLYLAFIGKLFGLF